MPQKVITFWDLETPFSEKGIHISLQGITDSKRLITFSKKSNQSFRIGILLL